MIHIEKLNTYRQKTKHKMLSSQSDVQMPFMASGHETDWVDSTGPRQHTCHEKKDNITCTQTRVSVHRCVMYIQTYVHASRAYIDLYMST